MSSVNSVVWDTVDISNRPIEVRLSDSQMEYCSRVSTDRRKGKTWHSGTSSNDMLGTIVEFAFQFVHEQFKDEFNGKILSGGDGGVDYFTKLGTAIDVKGSGENARWMYISDRQIRDCATDMFVFGRWMGNHVLFDGWMTVNDFVDIARFFDNKNIYGCWVSSLQNMEIFNGALDRSLF